MIIIHMMKQNLKPSCRIMTCLITGFVLIFPAAKQLHAQGLGNSNAVSDPFESQYFHNRYLGNPAMAGLDTVLHLEVSYRKQFTGFPGAPVTKALTADYNPGKRVGLGLIVYSDKAAMISRNRIAITYAYHLPVGQQGQQLHFGISGAFAQSRLDLKEIIGDENDPAVAAFNEHKNAFEVDYGMAFTGSHVTLQASLANLISYFKNLDNTTSDVSTFYVAAAYRFTFDGVVNAVEPQLSLRGVKQYNSIMDLGAQVTMLNRILYFYGMYHTSGNFSAGVGLNYKDIIYIQGAYLTQSGGLKNYTSGNYEIDLGLSLFGK